MMSRILFTGLITLLIVATPPSASANASCPKVEHVLFSARFKWPASALTRRTLRIRIARQKLGHGLREVAAWISSPHSCEARCQIQSIEPGTSSSWTLDLKCRSTKFGPLSTPATLFVTPDRSVPSQIRFGTWLQGYEQSPLLVDLNRSRELLQSGTKLGVSLARAAE